MMRPTQPTCTRTDPRAYSDARTLTGSAEQRQEEFVPGRGVVEINRHSAQKD